MTSTYLYLTINFYIMYLTYTTLFGLCSHTSLRNLSKSVVLVTS